MTLVTSERPKRRRNSDRAARYFFLLSLAFFVFGLGLVAGHYELFPMPLIRSAFAAAEDLRFRTGVSLPWYYTPADGTSRVPLSEPERMSPGLTLVASTGLADSSRVQILDANGRVVHAWSPDWFRIWPDAEHVPEDARPKSTGGLVHGVTMLPEGDLVFNFSELALVRMDPCGNVAWKIPYRTHHSVFQDDEGNLWVPGLHVRDEVREDAPNHAPPFHDYTLLHVTPAGDVLEELRVFDLLEMNGLTGLLYMSSTVNRSTTVTGDTMHLNDIEIFPASLAPGVFAPGDVMISLRNINAILVFDPGDWHVKYMSVGRVLRQHDPDFEDGNTISVFDNRNLRPDEGRSVALPAIEASRVVSISASTGTVVTEYTGGADHSFFTDIMGGHQRLPNGNLLLTESTAGRVMEIDTSGRTVWEYVNLVGDGLKGLVSDAYRLSPAFDEHFFHSVSARCESRPG